MNAEELVAIAKGVIECQTLRKVRACEHDREDVRQDAYLRLIRHAHKIDGSGKPHGYAFKVAASAIRDYHRRKRAAKEHTPRSQICLDELPAHECMPDPDIEKELREIQPLHREVLQLVIAGKTVSEIAEHFGCDERGASDRIYRAKRAIRKSRTRRGEDGH